MERGVILCNITLVILLANIAASMAIKEESKLTFISVIFSTKVKSMSSGRIYNAVRCSPALPELSFGGLPCGPRMIKDTFDQGSSPRAHSICQNGQPDWPVYKSNASF